MSVQARRGRKGGDPFIVESLQWESSCRVFPPSCLVILITFLLYCSATLVPEEVGRTFLLLPLPGFRPRSIIEFFERERERDLVSFLFLDEDKFRKRTTLVEDVSILIFFNRTDSILASPRQPPSVDSTRLDLGDRTFVRTT